MPDTHPPFSPSEAGYTLTELLVVLVILGFIAAAITPQVIGRLDSSKVKAAKLQLDSLSASLDLYKIDTGRYPGKEDGLDALLQKPDSAEIWDGPYVRGAKNLIDPWGASYIYLPPEDGATYRLVTLGADGIEGGVDLNQDLFVPDLTRQASR